MWLLLKGLALRFIVGRTVGGAFSLLLLLLVPLGGVLKFIGLPLLLILGVLGNGLTQLSVDSYIRDILVGSIIIAAVASTSLEKMRHN